MFKTIDRSSAQRGALFNFRVFTEIKLKVKHLNKIINEGNNDDTISSSAGESQEGLLQDFYVLEIHLAKKPAQTITIKNEANTEFR